MHPANPRAGAASLLSANLVAVVGLASAGAVLALLVAAAPVVLRLNADRVHAADIAKVAIALTAALLALADALVVALRRRVPRPLQIGLGGLLALAAVVAYFDGFQLSYPNYYHRWDLYHGYVGAKYYPELGSSELYACTIVAQDELGRVTVDTDAGRTFEVDMTAEARAPGRTIRDLRETRRLVPATSALEAPDRCKAAFAPARWEDFKRDVSFFRAQSQRRYFEDMQTDHGYKASPVWTAGARVLAALGSPSVGFMKLLAFVDLVFLLGVFGALWWAFGWRVSAAAAIFWGCQACSTFYWTGGAFLRHEWLLFLVLSACLLRKHHAKLAGASLAYAALLDGFPAFVAVGWVIFGLAQAIRARRLLPDAKGALIGAALCIAVALPVGTMATRASAWGAYWDAVVTHDLPVTNDMGLGVVLSHGYGNAPGAGRMKFSKDPKAVDPFADWRRMRQERSHTMWPALVVISLGVTAAFGFAMYRLRSMWAAAALGPVFIVLFTQMVCWNYPFLLLAAALTRLRRWLEVLLFGFAAVTQLVAIGFFYYDDRFAAMSGATTLFTGLLVLLFVRCKGAGPRVPAP